jgi:hypothetical protein
MNRSNQTAKIAVRMASRTFRAMRQRRRRLAKDIVAGG